MFNLFKRRGAVSEVLGTILLLGIAVALFSVLYLIVLSEPLDASEPYPTVVAYVEGNHLVIEHRGGDELGVDNEFKFNIGNKDYNREIGELLDDVNNDGKWNVGERLIITNETISDDIIKNEIFDWSNSDADIFGADEENKRSILTGSLDIRPSGDIGLEYSIDNNNPLIGDTVNITLTVSLFYGDLSTPNIKILFKLPDKLEFIDKYPSSANYDENTGVWLIDNLDVGNLVTLKVEALISDSNYYVEPTQLCMLVDGSGSILGPDSNIGDGPDWGLILDGLANATKDNIPHSGDVELTIVQFANNYASKEIGPIVVEEDNYLSIINDIQNIQQRAQNTPLSCGLYRSADELFNSLNNPSNNGIFQRQVLILVTDGEPNACSYTYNKYYGYGCYNARQDSVDARNYFKDTLFLNDTEDEINSLAVGTHYSAGPNLDWLKDNIVWPGQYIWEDGESPGPGWVRQVNDWYNFSQAIEEIFIYLFGEIRFQVELLDTPLIDLDNDNDLVTVVLKPKI